MHIVPRTLFADKHTWAANTTTKTDLPRNARTLRLVLMLTANVTVAAGATRNDDGLANLIKQVRVRRNGSDTIRNLPAKFLRVVNLIDYETQLRYNEVPTATTAAADYTAAFVVDFRRNRKDPHDVRGALNAVDASQLTLEIEWGAASDIGTNYTVNSATITVTQIEAFMKDAELDAVYGKRVGGPQGRREFDEVMYHSYQQKTVDAAYTNYQFPVDLPSGNIIERAFIFARSAGARSDALITAYKLKQQSPEPFDLMDFEWYASQFLDRQDYQIPTAIDGDFVAVGFTALDFNDTGLLDMRRAKKGDVRLEFTTAAPSGTTDISLLTEEWASAKA